MENMKIQVNGYEITFNPYFETFTVRLEGYGVISDYRSFLDAYISAYYG